MHKRLLCILFLLLSFLPMKIRASAEGMGVLRVNPKCNEDSVSGGTVTVRYIGILEGENYRINGKETDFLIAADELFLEETISLLQKHGFGPERTETSTEYGTFTFNNLREGLYLVYQHHAADGYSPIKAFLAYLPIGGEIWEEDAFPEVVRLQTDNPQTGDHPAPIIAAMVLILVVFALLILTDKRREL